MTFTEFFFNNWSDYCLVDASFIGVFMVWKQISLSFDTHENGRQPTEYGGRFRKHTKARYRNEVMGFSTVMTLALLAVMRFQYQMTNSSTAPVGTAQAPIPVQQPIPNSMNGNTDNLIANGDFDNIGNAFVDNNGWSDDLLSPGGTDIPGWQNIAPPWSPPGYADEAWDEPVNGYGVSASPDNGTGYLVDLTGSTDRKPYGGIGQSIRTLPGHRYKLTFDFGASMQYNSGAFGPAAMFVNVIGSTQLASEHLILTPTVSMQWDKETVLFTADSDTTMIEFIGDSNYTCDFIGLDNVGVFAAGTAQAPMPVQQPILNSMNGSTANLIVNGDFDNLGNAFVDNNGWSDDLLSPGGTDIPGWGNIAPPLAQPGYADEAWVEPVNGYGVSASPDNGTGYFVDLTGATDRKPYGGIGQSIKTLPGQQYKLTFDFGASIQYNSGALDPAAMFVHVIGATPLASQHFVLAPTSSMQWDKETVLFTADSNTTMIEFIGDSSYTSDFIGLDNVGVFAVDPK